MKNENSDNQSRQTERPKSRTIKIFTWVAVIAAGLFLFLFFGIPLFLSSSGGTNLLVGKINKSVDGQMQMDDFSIGWFRGVKLKNLSYTDDITSVTVRRIEIHPQYTALLGGKVKLGKTIIDQPQVYMKVSSSELQEPKTRPAEDKTTTQKGGLPVDQIDLQVIDGNATIELVDGTTQKLQIANIASNVQITKAGRPSSVDLSMNVDEADVSAKGTITPTKKGWTIEDSDFTVEVSNLELGSLKPLFALAGQSMDMTGQLNAEAAVQMKNGTLRHLQADATIKNFAQGSGQQRTTFEEPVILSALLMGSDDTIQIEKASVRSGFCTVNCSGTLDSLDYQVNADLAQTQRFAGQFIGMQGMAVKGQLAAQGKVDMTDERIALTGTGEAQQLVIQKDDVQTPSTDVKVDFDGALDQSANQFRLVSANLTATPGSVTVSNLVLPLSAETAKTVSLDAQAQMDLSQVWPFVQVFADVPKNLQITGMLDSTVKVMTEQSRIQLLTENTRIDNLKITQPDTEPFIQERVILTGDIILDTEAQRVDIRRLNLEAAEGESLIKINKGNVQKTSRQDTTSVSGELEVQYDLRAVSAVASPFLPEGLLLEGKRTDAVHFESQYPNDQIELMNANLNADATFGFDKAEFNGLNVGATEMKLNVVKGVMDFTIPKTTVNEGTMQFAARVDLKQDPLVLQLDQPTQLLENIHLNEEITNNLLTYLNPVFARQGNVSGFASLRCDRLLLPFSSEHKNQIVMDATVSIDNMRLKARGLVGQILSRTSNQTEFDAALLPTRFVLQDGVLTYDNMEFHLDEYPTGFSGKVYLDKRLDMEAAVPYRVDAQEGKIRSIKIGGDLSQRLKLPIEGTVDNPQIRLEKLFENVLQQYLQDRIQRGLGDILENL